MKNYKLEDIEYLRTKAPISYEEAVVLLDKYDGDMARAFVELEKKGLLGNKNNSDATNSKCCKNGKSLWETLSDGLKFLFSKHMIIKKGEKVIIDLPLAVWVLLFLILHGALLIGVIVVLLCGFTIDFYNINNPDVETKIDSIIDKASSAVKGAVNPTDDVKKAETEETIHVPYDDVITNM